MKSSHPFTHPAAFAAAITAGIVYVLCALAVGLWPGPTLRLMQDWFHGIDLSRIATMPDITAGSFLRGLLSIVIFTYLVIVLYVWLYGKCVVHCQKKGWIKG